MCLCNPIVRPLQADSLFPIAPETRRHAGGGSLFITRGYEQDTKNERSSSATEMIVEASTVDVLDSE